MKRIEESRLARLALAVLEEKGGVRFDMSSFTNLSPPKEERLLNPKKHKLDCSTSCCAAGLIPVVFPRLAVKAWKGESGFDFDELVEILLGSDFVENKPAALFPKQWTQLGYFLFGGEWPSDRRLFAVRALTVLENKVPDRKWRYLNSTKKLPEFDRRISLKNLTAKLQAYL